MDLQRRALLAALPVVLATPAWAESPPTEAIAEYEKVSGGHIGVYARNLATGAELGWRAQERFVMCSTFKASLAALVLRRVDHGQERLDAKVAYSAADVDLPDWYAPAAKANLAKGSMSIAEMCKAAVELSDNTCANLLLARVGGPAALTAFWRSVGDDVSRLDDPEPILNRTPPGGVKDTTTPAAMAASLRRFVLGDVLAPPSRALLTSWLVGCQTGADRLRGGLPAAWTIGDKTGNNGKDGFGDIAVVWPAPKRPIVIAAYTRGGAPSAAQVKAAFAGVGRAVAAKLA